ncbi:hypothetical protein CABS03_04887 [Colletotrichum abscissum]|uniref:Uncharacterized protein n=2 Tax=Colletotrichum acutatum species complex TaxID=2707335 RepID=A0A9P9X361_9PEZI|nr:hypothetical protein CABS02_13517 [Colletotrichum abscissum]KAK0375766.1 hypothetical protein CLIM01_06866 [Colletotrichum limetticola]
MLIICKLGRATTPKWPLAFHPPARQPGNTMSWPGNQSKLCPETRELRPSHTRSRYPISAYKPHLPALHTLL